MSSRLLLIIFFDLSATVALGQISRHEANAMVHALEKSPAALDRIDLLLNLAQFHILKPGEHQVDFDSAIHYMNEAKTLNSTLRSSDAEGYLLLTEAFMIREIGQREKGMKLTEEAVNILESGNNKTYLGIAYYELAWYYNHFSNQERPEKIRLVKESVKCFRQARNTKKTARALEMLGDLYDINEDFKDAIAVLKDALASYDSLRDSNVQGVYVILGRVHWGMGMYDQALYYLLKALKTAHSVGDTSMQLCNINHSLASLYDVIGQDGLAEIYEKEALQISRKYMDESNTFFLSVSLSIHLNKIGKSEEALELLDSIPESSRSSLDEIDKAYLYEGYFRNYLTLKQYGNAQQFIEPLLVAAADGVMLTPMERATIHRFVAKYYFLTNQFSKARATLTKNQAILREKNNYLAHIYDANVWYKLDSAQGDFRSAFNHLLFHKTKMDSILGENRVRQLQVLGVEYEIAIKDDSIKLKDKNIELLKQANSLQQASLQQANIIKNVTVGGIALALVIIGLLYRLYQHKQKSNGVITQKNEQLKHFLKEKEWLLKEIHHRVKNNLQIVMSLLNSQSAYIDNESALTAIHDSQHRVHAISLIHQKLYNAQNVSSIDISFYIRELVSYLTDCFNTGQRIRFDLDIDRLEMDVSQAVPLGLILNEAITNAIKYAFPDGRIGVVSVSLVQCDRPGQFMLEISDDGIGMPARLNTRKPGSLGLSLIAGLSEDLDGGFSIESKHGTTLRVTFVHEPGVKRTNKIIESLALDV